MKRMCASVAAAVTIFGLTGVASGVDSNRVAERRFADRIYDYLRLRCVAERQVSQLHVSSNPEAIAATVDALGEAIRAVRPRAKVGDIFVPNVRTAFRGLIEDALKLHEVQAADLVAVINREAPPFRPDLMVNGPFDWRFGALMPPYLIEALPPLPAQLQYRLVDRELVLIDIEAGLIVDVLSRALTVD